MGVTTHGQAAGSNADGRADAAADLASQHAQSAVPRPRDATFDILKGISILEVMTHHLLSTAMRKFCSCWVSSEKRTAGQSNCMA